LTDEKGLYLGILTADCVPLLLLDPRRSVVGAVHAGWRGTAKGIVGKALREMHHKFGSRAEDVLVAIGPAIGPCCYLVGEEVARAFLQIDPANRGFLDPEGSGRWKMNLEGINRHQLINAGIKDENVFPCSLCTCCRKDLFFSVRAEGEPTGRQIALIGLRSQPT
jgi:YfiH family protein